MLCSASHFSPPASHSGRKGWWPSQDRSASGRNARSAATRYRDHQKFRQSCLTRPPPPGGEQPHESSGGGVFKCIYIYCTVYIHVCWNYMILHGILWDCGISYSSVLYQYHIISYYTILSQCTTLYFFTSYNSTIIYIVSCCGALSVIMFIAYDISWCYFLSQKS